MDEMLSYQLEIGSRVYQMSRDVLSAYNSRHFTINTVPATQVGYIYTTTGIKFYEPLTIDNVTIAEMDWEDGKFVDPVTGCEISQIMTDDTYEVSTSNVAIKSANVTVKPGNPNTYYVIGAYPAADAQTKSDAAICNEIMSKINSVNDLFSGEASTTLALKAETEYIACAFSVTIINEYIYPTSGLSKSAPFTTLPDVPMKDEYKAWLGTWTLTSTSSEVTAKPVVLILGSWLGILGSPGTSIRRSRRSRARTWSSRTERFWVWTATTRSRGARFPRFPMIRVRGWSAACRRRSRCRSMRTASRPR